MEEDFIACTLKELPLDQQEAAAEYAIALNPMNRPPVEMLSMFAFISDFVSGPSLLTALTSKYWGAKGAHLTVGFMEETPADLRNRILAHANAWSEHCNVSFRWTQTDPQIRVSRGPGGYYAYLGPDNLQIPKNQQTMNLERFTMRTPESEFIRVVRHEFGHVLGFPHEHQRREIVALLDEQKTIEYFRRTQGWSPQQTKQQVFMPLEERSLLDPQHSSPDVHSIMAYSFPASITKTGQGIPGGADIDAEDAAYAARIYPKPDAPQPPPPPPPPPGGTLTLTLPQDLAAGTYSLLKKATAMASTLTPPFPTVQEFLAAAPVAIGFFRGATSAPDASRAGWIVAGYALTHLDRFFVPAHALASLSDDAAADLIQQAVLVAQREQAQGPSAAVGFDWWTLLSLAWELISQFRKRGG